MTKRMGGKKLKRALIFIREDGRLDSGKAQENASYLARRGYKLVALVRAWRRVEEYLARGDVDVVVFGSCHGPLPGEETRILKGSGGIGGDSGTTQPIGRVATRAGEGTRVIASTSRGWTAGRLREVLDSDGAIPAGLDPESIAAARRIARALDAATHGDEGRV